MTTLRVIVDDIVAVGGDRLGRYAEDLTRALIATAPRGTNVAGVVAASPEGDYALLRERLPGLTELHKSALARRELAAAWQHGFTTLPGNGMVHATSLLAPLRRHDRLSNPGEQTVVTIHDAIAWTSPELLPSRLASWQRTMGKRAEKYADAVVVPTHAVAAELSEQLALGDRLRVIGSAPSTALAVPPDSADRRERLGLPTRYVLAIVEDDAPNGFPDLLAAIGHPDAHGTRLVIVAGAKSAARLMSDSPSSGATTPDAPWRDRVTVVDPETDADLSAIYAGAGAYVQPSVAAGFGAPMLDAMAAGLPLVISDAPALVEVADDGARVVPRGDNFVAELAATIAELIEDRPAAERLGIAAQDRARAFSWRDAAEKVWQLHADL
ncbi:MAG: glycosyltransferase [Pseudolysinimonas sp.]|uniref:glycosyltransferase n=1 Tax=Pseudolysinimonas sp. TaxID=2680009 RepID=UPI0032657655